MIFQIKILAKICNKNYIKLLVRNTLLLLLKYYRIFINEILDDICFFSSQNCLDRIYS